jgi:hypothetical protein
MLCGAWKHDKLIGDLAVTLAGLGTQHEYEVAQRNEQTDSIHVVLQYVRLILFP